MAYDQGFAKKLNDHVHGVAALPMPTGHRLRLMTVNGDADTAGTEVASGGGYVSGSGAPLLTYLDSTLATPSMSTSEIAVTVSNYPRVETVVGIEIWDSTPSRLEYGALATPRLMAIGDTLSFAAAEISSALS